MNEYYLVFGNGKHWLCKFLKKDFQHVFVIWRNIYGWHYLNPRNNCLETNPLPYLMKQDVPTIYAKQGYTVVRLSMPQFKKHIGRHGFKFTNCVWIIKYFLGLSVRAYTPYGLYKALFKQDYLKTGILAQQILR